MGTGKQRRTFISYSRVNKDFALKLAKQLKSDGFSVWLDQLDIPAGVRWDDEIERALEACEVFMVILTPASITSDNVKDEIGFAIDNHKRILPILLENANLPFRLRRFQYVDFTGKSFDEGVESAKELLRGLIATPTDPMMQVPPVFRESDAKADQQEDARLLAAQQAERLAELKADEERAAKAEAERKAKEEADRLAAQKEEEDRLARQKVDEELAAKATAEMERKGKAEAKRKAKEEADRLAAQKAQEERAAKAEADRKAKEEAERLAAQKQQAESPMPTPVSAAQIPQAQSVPPKKKMPMPLIIGAVVGVGLCAVVGIIFLLNNGGGGAVATQAPAVEQSNPTDVPAPVATEAAIFTEAPVATEAPVSENPQQIPITGDLHVFGDDFSDPNSGWSVDDDHYYENGHYYLKTVDETQSTMASPNTTFADYGPDVIITADITSAVDTSLGVYCRMQGNGAFYLFQVGGKTTYSIWYNDGSQWESLASGDLTSGDDPYNVEAHCIGDSLTMYVNYGQVASVTDSRLANAGELGLYTETTNTSGSTAEFGNFFAYAPFNTDVCVGFSDNQRKVQFENQSGVDLVVFSSVSDCSAYPVGILRAGGTGSQTVYLGKPYVFVDPRANSVRFEYVAQDGDTSIIIP